MKKLILIPNVTRLGSLLISCLLIGMPLSANPLAGVEHITPPVSIQISKDENKPPEPIYRPSGCCAGPIKKPSP